jgi:hypothetical protein
VNQDKKVENKRVSLARDYKITFGTEQGNNVLKHLIKTYYMPDQFCDDSHKTAYNLGRKKVVQNILVNVGIDPTRLQETIDKINQEEGPTL